MNKFIFMSKEPIGQDYPTNKVEQAVARAHQILGHLVIAEDVMVEFAGAGLGGQEVVPLSPWTG